MLVASTVLVGCIDPTGARQRDVNKCKGYGHTGQNLASCLERREDKRAASLRRAADLLDTSPKLRCTTNHGTVYSSTTCY